MDINRIQLPAELRFNSQRVSTGRQENSAFGLDQIDFGAFDVKAGNDLMPLCGGAAQDVNSAGDLMPLCKGAAKDVNSAGDLMPLCKGAAKDVNSAGDLMPLCKGAAQDVNSGLSFPTGGFHFA